MDPVDIQLLRKQILAALEEDVGCGDVTSRALVSEAAAAIGRYVAKQKLVVCGLAAAAEVVGSCDSGLEFESSATDGVEVDAGTVLATVRGRARSILTAERTSLNFLQRMAGVATATREYVRRVEGLPVRIIDTRKTAPGLRRLDKYAVRCGGGENHRAGLFDGVLIKNNHLAFHPRIGDAVHEARFRLGARMKIEVEVREIGQIAEAVSAGADMILLDNFTPEETRRAVEEVRGRALLESSGGITLENVRSYAETGVDFISIGALTHSTIAVDIHLQVTPS